MQKIEKDRLMKTKLLYPFVGVIITGIVVFFICLLKRPCTQWERPESVPVSAIWKGGCDGGFWVEIVDIRSDTIRFRIYQDWNGELLLDADFVSENCKDLLLTKANWDEYIDYFDGTKIYSEIQQGGNSYCRLIPIYPSYYEKK